MPIEHFVTLHAVPASRTPIRHSNLAIYTLLRVQLNLKSEKRPENGEFAKYICIVHRFFWC